MCLLRAFATVALAALRLLEMCPLMPVDAFVPIVGLNSWTAGYQQLARLRRAGLVEVMQSESELPAGGAQSRAVEDHESRNAGNRDC